MTRGTGSKRLPLIILFAFLLIACGRDILFTDNINMPSEIWKSDNTAVFRPEITDTSSVSNISFTIRTGASYPYRNIWLFINTTSPSGRQITDTLQFMLADETGKWYGKGFGDIHELNLPFRRAIYFPEKGIYTFSVIHGMRTNDLRGVYDFGIIIGKAEKQ